MSRARRGLTWIEVVVVILVLGLLLAMLLPTIGSHQAPRRSVCANNLKQLALAIHNYHEARNSLPPMCADPQQPMTASWIVAIMPYLEMQNVYYKLEKNLQATEQGAQEAWVLDLNGNELHVQDFKANCFVCPVRRGPMLSTLGKVTTTPTDYCAINSSSACWFGSSEGSAANGCIVEPSSGTQLVDGKLVQPKSRTNFDSITDGVSYTAIVGEKHIYESWKLGNTGRTADGQSAADGPCVLGGAVENLALFHSRRLGGIATGSDCSLTSETTIPLSNMKSGDGLRPEHLQAFGSWHPGITQFAMADGSVQIVKNFNDPRALSALGGRNDGEPYQLQ